MSNDLIRESSPNVEYPLNIINNSLEKGARSVSVSTLPPYELDPLTRQLIEENEDMLYKINTLSRDLQLSHNEIQKYKDIIVEKNKELEAIRNKMNDAAVQACDASGKFINYKTECERLTEDNKCLKEEYEKVCAALEQQTTDIREGMTDVHMDKGKEQISELVKQLYQEIVNLFPNVDRAVCSLKRSIVVSAGHPERVLESAQKELSSLQRLAHFLRRIDIGDENRVNNLISCVHRKEVLSSPGDLAILIRWMIVQAFQSGLSATEGNLRAIMTLMTTDRINANNNTTTVEDSSKKGKSRLSGGVMKQKIPNITK